MIHTELVLVCNDCLAEGRGVVKAEKVIDCTECKTPMKVIGEVNEFRQDGEQTLQA